MKYEWDESKRQEIIAVRDLDIRELGPAVFEDPDVKIRDDDRRDYGEERFNAYGMVGNLRLCLCFTYREGGEVMRFITIFIVNKKDWENKYGKDS